MNDPYIKRLVAGLTVILLGLYVAYIWPFYSGQDGRLGVDYPYFFVRMTSAELYFMQSGFFSVPWFTPAMCAGSFQFANPIDVTYSIPQLLSMLLDPLTAVFVSHGLFAFIGGVGTYLLIRQAPFRVSVAPAFAAAVLFGFNGFFMARMITGHLNFHTFMLVSLIAWLLLRGRVSSAIYAGLLAALVVLGGGAHQVIPMGLSILMVLMLASCYSGQLINPVRSVAIAIASAMCLSASKVTAILALLTNFPRSLYQLQGIDSFGSSLWIPFQSLLWGWDESPGSVRGDWALASYEWDYSLSPVILPCLLLTSFFALTRYGHRVKRFGVRLLPLLILPLVVNYYHPDWHQILKSLPIFGESVSLFRWYASYLLLLVVLSAIGLDQLSRRYSLSMSILVVILAVGWQLLRAPSWEKLPVVDYHLVLRGLEEARENGVTPISRIDAELNSAGVPARVHASRDVRFTEGHSQVFCYDAIFGYRNELLRVDNLRLGPVNKTIGNELNIKNPACYIYPRANNCVAGDNFTTEQAELALRFINYMSWDFERPWYQTFANWLSGLSWLVLFLLMPIATYRAVRQA